MTTIMLYIKLNHRSSGRAVPPSPSERGGVRMYSAVNIENYLETADLK